MEILEIIDTELKIGGLAKDSHTMHSIHKYLWK
jgi:hypothetical protein